VTSFWTKAIYFKPIELKPILLENIIKCLSDFSVILKYLTLNDFEMRFYGKNVLSSV